MTPNKSSKAPPENALAKKALEEISRIDREAQERKLAQVEALQGARRSILERMAELQRQLEQIDDAVARVTGKDPAQPRRQRRDLSEDRERVARWMAGRQGQKFGAGDLVREFPELEGTPISIFLKPLVTSGRIKADISDGIRRTKYFVG